MKNRKKTLGKFLFIIIVSIIFIYLTGSSFLQQLNEQLESNSENTVPKYYDEDLVVHFIDVGQGDSILIQLPSGQNMLIDAGDNDQGDKVVEYLKGQGVEIIDFLVGTHPHADHIGGLDRVIDGFDIGQMYMPKVVHTTKTYMDVLEAADRKDLKIKAAYDGMDIPLEGAEARILAPEQNLKSDNLNDYSIVLRLVYGNTVFMFQGDAESKTEQNILESGVVDIKADVIKLGHHGSSSSNTREYIRAINPTYAVITVGKGNKYGHPHREVLTLMKKEGITVYRTDEQGSIVAVSNGKKVSFNE